MFGAPLPRPQFTASIPVVHPLTGEWLQRGLYCCGPTGLGALTAHLESRGVEVNADALSALLRPLIETGRVIAKAGPFGVVLYALRGQGTW